MRPLPALLTALIASQLAASRGLAQSPLPAAPGSYQRITGQSNPAFHYFTRTPAPRLTANARPTAPAAASGPKPPVSQVAKPFANSQRGPVVSPYLALDVNEGLTGMPAYYALVRPRLDQIRDSQAQQAQYARLQRQMSAVSAAPTPQAAGYTARFLNNGGYFPPPR